MTLGTKRRELARLSLLFAGLGVLQFFYHYLDSLARDHHVNPLFPFVEEMTGVYGILPLYLLLLRPTVMRWRPDRQPWKQWLPVYFAALLIFSFLHTTWNWTTRVILFALCGQGFYDYGRMPIRYAMEFPIDVVIFAMSAAIVAGLARMKEAARLESDLAKAQLEALSLQLQPHFLFNALNAVSAAIYEDPRKADIMLGRVADFLRRMLARTQAQEVSLEQELETVNLYLEVMKARFEDKLRIEWRVDAALRDRAVPQLILQPIIENAIRYGAEPGSAQVSIELGVTSQNGSLILSVRDHGPGLNPQSTAGVGLANTRRWLERLYGAAGQLYLEDAPDGGAEARIQLPSRVWSPEE